jgi:hypothetical protein
VIDIGGQLSAGGLGERYPEVMTRRLVTLAYPVLADANKAAIDSFRAEHDAYHVGVVEAHFTIVFEAEGLDEYDYLNHRHDCRDGIANKLSLSVRDAGS